MKVPRVRFTIWRLMILIVAVALPLGIWVQVVYRRDQFRDLADWHRGQIKGQMIGRGPPYFISLWPCEFDGTTLRDLTDGERRRDEYHFELYAKYLDASKRPWLAVQPDPPEPE